MVGRVNLQNTEAARQLDIRGWTGGAFLLLGVRIWHLGSELKSVGPA